MQLASFETNDEYNAVRNLCRYNSGSFTDWIYVDGMTTTPGSKYDWYLSSGEKINFSLPWPNTDPNGSVANQEACLVLLKNKDYVFGDLHCSSHYPKKFICEEAAVYYKK
jgi:hypothetical protein